MIQLRGKRIFRPVRRHASTECNHSKRRFQFMKRILLGGVLLSLLFSLLVQAQDLTTAPAIAGMVSHIDANHFPALDVTTQNFFKRHSCSDTLAPGKGVT